MKMFFRSIIPVIFLLSLSQFGQAQIDLSINYQRTTFSDWDEAIKETYRTEEAFFKQAYGASIAYHYYPWDFRLGFVPEINATYLNEERSNDYYHGIYNLFQIGFGLPIEVFPYDFYGSCNCPTFTKENDFFRKSIYLKFIPEIAYQILSYEDEDTFVSNNLTFSIGGGIGMNIAVSDKFTIAPEVSYHRTMSEEWEGFSSYHDEGDFLDKTSASSVRMGIRFSFYITE